MAYPFIIAHILQKVNGKIFDFTIAACDVRKKKSELFFFVRYPQQFNTRIENSGIAICVAQKKKQVFLRSLSSVVQYQNHQNHLF